MNNHPTTTISVAEARNRLSELIERAAIAGEKFVIEKYGKPKAVIAALPKFASYKDKFDPVAELAGVWDNKDGDIIAKYARRLRRTAKITR